MSIKISGGTLKGRNITFPAAQGLRPTSSRVREAIFSALESHRELSGTTVADFFAGSGVLGFEALSRGASSLVAVESNGGLIKAMSNNAEQLGAKSSVATLQLDIETWLRKPKELFKSPIDFVFIDPPYELDLKQHVAAKLVQQLVSLSNYCKKSVFVIEQSSKAAALAETLAEVGALGLETFWTRVYGDTKVTFVEAAAKEPRDE